MSANLISRKGNSIAPIRRLIVAIKLAVFLACIAGLNAAPSAQGQAPSSDVPATSSCREVRRIFGTGVQRELKSLAINLRPCELQVHLLHLEAGRYVRIAMHMHGIDATLTAFAPDGTLLSRITEPSIIEGKKNVWFVTETSGVYSLEIMATAGAAAGSYDLLSARNIPATEEYRDFIRIDQGINEGVHLQEIGTEQALRQAIPMLHEIVSLAERNEIWPEMGAAIWMRGTPLMYLGEIYLRLGEPDNALKAFNRALEVDRWHDRGWTLKGIGDVYDALGDKQRALDYYLRSLPAFEITYSSYDKSKRGPAIAKSAIGGHYASLGDYDRALVYLEQSLEHWRTDGEIRGEAGTLMQISDIYVRLGRFHDALAHYNQALRVYRSTSDHMRASRALCAAARVRIKLGEYAEALSALDESLQSAHVAGDRLGQADALVEIGRVYHLAANNEKALDYLHQSLETYRSLRAAHGEAGSLYAIARVERDNGNFTEALSRIESAIERIEATRIGLTDEQLRTAYLASVRDYFDLYVDVLMRMHRRSPDAGFDREALAVSERARARSLVDSLGGILNGLTGSDSALIERRGSLWQRIRMRIARRSEEESYFDWINELEKLSAEYEQIDEQIRSANHRYAALTQPRTLASREIRNLLDDDTLLIEYSLGDENSYLWAVTSESIVSRELPKRTEIEQSARRVYDSLTARNRRPKGESGAQFAARIAKADAEYHIAAAELSRIILGPIAAQLGAKRLVIVAEGALQFIPFAALPRPSPDMGRNRPLIADHEIVMLPSASVMTLLREESARRRPAPGAVAVLADPVFTDDDPRLRRTIAKSGGGRRANARKRTSSLSLSTEIKSDLERALEDTGELADGRNLPRLLSTRWEAEQILSLTPKASFQALDFDASRETALSGRLSEYRIIHFASHAIINEINPQLSGMVLSMVDGQGRARNGYLRVEDVYNMKLSADLVVLSACRTGLGKDVRGEGLIGLTRGFMYAGAPRVVVSLWRVHDQATADLMKRFYSHMFPDSRARLGVGKRASAKGRNETPSSTASALRSAQLEMLKDRRWRSPYFWAGFTLQGEWR